MFKKQNDAVAYFDADDDVVPQPRVVVDGRVDVFRRLASQRQMRRQRTSAHAQLHQNLRPTAEAQSRRPPTPGQIRRRPKVGRGDVII